MPLLVLIVLFSLLGSVISVSLAAIVLGIPETKRRALLPYLVSYAAGTLLGAAFLSILPEALHSNIGSARLLRTVLVGIIVFFILEKLVLWRHCHKANCEVHSSAGPLILFGDALHNLVDGVIIAGSFFVSIPAGITVSVAVITHEVPQEIGDFALLINYGYNRKRAILFNLLSSFATVVGALGAFFALHQFREIIPFILAFSAASFIYIALADIVPGLNKTTGLKATLLQLCLIISGAATIALMERF